MSIIRGTCEQCLNPFSRKGRAGTERVRDAGRFCSRECGFAWQRADGVARTEATAAAKLRATERPCLHCGNTFTGRGKAPTCSAVCTKARRARIVGASRMAARHADKPQECRCRECGEPFRRRLIKHDQNIFCSPECKRRDKSRRNDEWARRTGRNGTHCQRARRRGLPFDRSITGEKVFARAGWRCQICERQTPVESMGSMADNAPEIDHVVPMSADGPHVWSNVQCACRKCNNDKGSRIPTAAEQQRWKARIQTPPDVAEGLSPAILLGDSTPNNAPEVSRAARVIEQGGIPSASAGAR